jgi:hypothetical protein
MGCDDKDSPPTNSNRILVIVVLFALFLFADIILPICVAIVWLLIELSHQIKQQNFKMERGADDFDILSVSASAIHAAAAYTTPFETLGFYILLAIGAYFHESYFVSTLIIVALYCAVQWFDSFAEEDYKTTFFRAITEVFIRAFIYLGAGIVWVVIKVQFSILIGPIQESIKLQFDAANGTSEKMTVILPIICQWTVTWPMNLIHSITRNRLVVILETVLRFGEEYFVVAFESAFNSTATPASAMWFIGSVAGYMATGYILAHLILYCKVRFSELPKNLQAKVDQIYNDDGSYIHFVISIKWLIMRWMVTWPIEILYTLLKEPTRYMFDIIYNLSVSKLVWIVKKASQYKNKQD